MTSTLSSNITTGLDSMNKLSELVNKAQEFGLSGIAITNHDNLCEVININREQKRLRKENSDFVLAIGNEIYLIDEYIDDDSVKQIYYHFILIAKDKIGYQALVHLSSRAWYRSSILRGKRRVPTEKADVEEIMSWAKGHVVATTACLGGELAKRVLADELEEASNFYDWCIQQFGKDDFFIELQPSRIPDQIKYNKRVTSLFPNANFTIATDTHFLLEEDFPIFEAFLRSDEKNKKREVKEFYDYARLMREEEIFSLMREMGFTDSFVRKCLDNTNSVGRQIEFYDLAQKQIIPKIPLEDIDLILSSVMLEEVKKYPTLNWGLAADDVGTRYCTQYCLNSMVMKGIWDTAHLERLEEEFEVHKFQSEQLESNFFNYVNVMQWVINLSWSIDCAVGPSRGSASGCLLNYLMDVVQNDPLKYDLPFFRYLHKERVTPLDIDTDFQPSKRAALFAAIREQRGELGLTQVATYRTLTLKAAIATAGRGYRSEEFPQGLDSDITTYLSSLIEVRRGFVATLKQTLYGDETTGYTRNTVFINECNQYKGLLDIIIAVEGLVVGSGTHAAAVILFDEQDRIFDHCSLMRAPNGDLCTSLDLHTVEEAGCYKYDFLLLSTLDIQATCFKLLQKHNKIDPNMSLKECFRTYINPNTIDYTDKRIWQHLYDNDVLSIFQFDAASGRRGVLATKPESLAEMTAVNGLIRLVTPEDGEDQLDRFCVNKEFPDRFEKEMVSAGLPIEVRQIMHEVLDPYQGCAATQETFMVLTRRLLGYSLKDADVLRKVVAKKKMSEIQTQRDFFEAKGKEKEYSEEQLNYLWNVVIAPSLGWKACPYTPNQLSLGLFNTANGGKVPC